MKTGELEKTKGVEFQTDRIVLPVQLGSMNNNGSTMMTRESLGKVTQTFLIKSETDALYE